MTHAQSRKVAIVTGGNRGLGFETCNGFHVILTSRGEKAGKAAAAELVKEGLQAAFHPLDVTRQEDVDRLEAWVRKELGRLDVLVNNAGILIDDEAGSTSAFQVPVELIRRTVETNVYGTFRMCQKLIPLMREGGYGRVVNVSSGMGQLSEMNGGYPGYRISKTAVNAITRIFAEETQGANILVNSVCPGWVKTDMGGPGAELTPEEGVDTIVWLCMLPNNGQTGGFYRERKRIEW
jgi:NAD(P)-dependent dehydrogenase (short-subunit alcohol dehydrogenase family)